VAIPDGRGGFRAVPPAILFRDLLRLTTEGGLDRPQALALVTSNVARVLGLGDGRVAIAPSMEADLLVREGASSGRWLPDASSST
jgi:beta-aspartyl-dipeptidase (metallo-type)